MRANKLETAVQDCWLVWPHCGFCMYMYVYSTGMDMKSAHTSDVLLPISFLATFMAGQLSPLTPQYSLSTPDTETKHLHSSFTGLTCIPSHFLFSQSTPTDSDQQPPEQVDTPTASWSIDHALPAYSLCLSVCLSICVSVYLSVSPSLCLCVCLSLYLSVCVSLCLCLSRSEWS